jgi:ATP-dependent Clp protease ATP-binding subunit ClpA
VVLLLRPKTYFKVDQFSGGESGGRERGAARLLASTSRGGRRRRRGDRPVVAPEFRNRLDAIVPFAGLPEAVISRVVDKFILQLEGQLSGRNVTIELTDEGRGG